MRVRAARSSRSMFGAMLLLLASNAEALTLVPATFAVDAPGVSGEVTLISVASGVPAGGVVSLGATGGGDTTLVLGASLDVGSGGGTGLHLSLRALDGTPVFFTGAGFVPGPATDILILGAAGGVVTFVPAALTGGTVLDAVFLSFPSPLPDDGTLMLHASFVAASQSDGSALLVPEPGAAGLLVLGLAILAGARRPCSRSGRRT